MSDLRENPVQIDFEPRADSRQDGADLLDGLYLSDDRLNTTIESYDNAKSEAVVCGIGGWELLTEYETNRAGDKNQVIRRRPIYEANNNSFPDPNAKRLDKSDAKYWSILVAYSKDGYKDLYKELTGEETDATLENFRCPQQSFAFPWIANHNEIYYVVRFYHKALVKDKILTFIDPLGQPVRYRESDVLDIVDELIDEGYEIDESATKVIKRWQIKRYIASGEKILKIEDVAGDKIPVVVTYGERAMVEGGEVWEGVTRLAKDPQRLRNFQLSYLADIVSRSPRPKPIFFADQVAGVEQMYEQNGADNNYPYYLLNRYDANNKELPLGPAGEMPEQKLPDSLVASINLSREAVTDVAPGGAPKDMADIDLSGKAVAALEARLDQQSIVYQQNFKHALRWDAEIYASMASSVYDAPRLVTLTLQDGTRRQVQIMETILDEESGELKTLNDLTNVEFDVFAEIGPSYASKKEQTIEQLGGMAEAFKESDPAMHKILMLKQLELIDGVNFDDVRDYSRKQLILMGIKEPETEEDMAILQQAQNQQQQPDAPMLLAMAENKKADAEILKQQREAVKDQKSDENDDAKIQIEAYKAETDRRKVQVDAAQAGFNIRFTNSKTQGQNIDNVLKLTEPFRARVSNY